MDMGRGGIAALLLALITCSAALAQGSWAEGQIVGLRAGTCIREGPGAAYRAHTRVPEDEWAVMVIGGPRFADGRTWWDTSRRAAGDPSGGTGWVAEDQGDTDCAADGASSQGGAAQQSPPPSGGRDTPAPQSPPGGVEALKVWWYQQPALVKWAVAVIALLLAPALWRLVGGAVIEGVAALFIALAVWTVLDLTRQLWQDLWLSLAGPLFGGDTPDMALLLAVLPLVSWALALLGRRLRLRGR